MMRFVKTIWTLNKAALGYNKNKGLFMHIKFGPYNIRAHELDNKLILQVSSKSGKVSIKEDDTVYPYDFPNGIHYEIEGVKDVQKPKDLKRYRFGEYSFIFGINNSGLFSLFYSKKLFVKKKFIDGIDTLTFTFTSEPKSNTL